MTIVDHVDPFGVPGLLDELEEVYLDAYADPPYAYGTLQASAFREQLVSQAQTTGFALVVATDEDQLVGFTQGVPFPAGRWWRYATTPAPTDIVDRTKFAVIQFVVTRAAQGRGVGHELMRTLLVQRPEEYGILTSYPDVKARSVYAHWGWRQVGNSHPPDLAEMDALALPLMAARATSPLFQTRA